MQGIRNQVPFWNETSTVALPARFQTRQQGSAECFSKPLVWLQSCLCPGSRLVLRSFGSLFRANPFAFGDLEGADFFVREVCCWFVCSRKSRCSAFTSSPCLHYLQSLHGRRLAKSFLTSWGRHASWPCLGPLS